MTILNVAIGANDAAILTDSRMSSSGLAADVAATKVLALPTHGALLAHAGSCMAELVEELHSRLRLGILAGSVLDLAQRMPQTLQELHNRHGTATGYFVLVGIVDERAHGFQFDSPAWEARPIPAGVQLMPAMRSPDPDATSIEYAPGIVQPIGELVEALPSDPRPAPDFRDSVRAITHATRLQLEQNPITCGEPLILSRVDCAGIAQMRVEP